MHIQKVETTGLAVIAMIAATSCACVVGLAEISEDQSQPGHPVPAWADAGCFPVHQQVAIPGDPGGAPINLASLSPLCCHASLQSACKIAQRTTLAVSAQKIGTATVQGIFCAC